MRSVKTMLIVLAPIVAIGLFTISCASTQQIKTAKVPEVDENGNPIDWEKEIEAYNADPKKKIKFVCKKITPTGSHIPRTICMTTVTMENRRRQDQRAIQDFVRACK